MTLREIFVLNDVLDNEDICFLPPLSKLEMTGKSYGEAKAALIKCGFLKNPDEFTDTGVLATKMLRDYKQAKKHVKVLSLAIGILKNEKAVLINEIHENDYEISLISTKNIVSQFLESFYFFKTATESKTLTEIKIDSEKLAEKYPESEGNLRLESKNERGSTDEMCFFINNQLYIYDFMLKTLYPKSHEDIISLFNERLVIS